MTGPEHYREAERLLEEAESRNRDLARSPLPTHPNSLPSYGVLFYQLTGDQQSKAQMTKRRHSSASLLARPL